MPEWVELRGPTLVSATTPRESTPPHYPVHVRTLACQQGVDGARGFEGHGRGPAFADKRRPAPPGYVSVRASTQHLLRAALFSVRARPFRGRALFGHSGAAPGAHDLEQPSQ